MTVDNGGAPSPSGGQGPGGEGGRGLLLSLGSVNADMQQRAPRWPEPGETLVGQDFVMLGGGKGANRAFLAQRLGLRAQLLAQVGNDPLATVALAPLQDAGVDLAQVVRTDRAPTGTAMIVVRSDGEKTILLAGNANDVWDDRGTEGAIRAVESAPDGSLLTVDLEVTPAVVKGAIRAARRRGFLVLVDPSPAERLDQDLWPLIDVMTPNRSEAEALVGRSLDTPELAFDAADTFCRRGARAALVKLRGGGCVGVAGGERFLLRAVPVQVVDATGAGDAFAGALAVGLWQGLPLRQAAEMAVAASTLAVTAFGSQPAYPDRTRLEAMVTQVRQRNRS